MEGVEAEEEQHVGPVICRCSSAVAAEAECALAVEAAEESAGPYSTKLIPSMMAYRYRLSWAAVEADVDVLLLLLLSSPRSLAAVEAADGTEEGNHVAGTGLGCETGTW